MLPPALTLLHFHPITGRLILMSDSVAPPLVPAEGLHVLHLFYVVDAESWEDLESPGQKTNRERFRSTIQELRALPETQLLTFAVVGTKADLGFMLVGKDLQSLNAAEKRLTQSLGAGILQPVYSYFSMTERSEYTTSEEDYIANTLKGERNLEEGSEAFQSALEEFRTRMAKYGKDRLYPNLADWPVLCFYNMNKRRDPQQNWYALPFEERKKLMGGHARVGRQWAGKIRQLITGSTGLDDEEWGVTLFAHDTYDIKGIVYEMRFDEVSAQYADFGPFYIGLQLEPDALLDRIFPMFYL